MLKHIFIDGYIDTADKLTRPETLDFFVDKSQPTKDRSRHGQYMRRLFLYKTKRRKETKPSNQLVCRSSKSVERAVMTDNKRVRRICSKHIKIEAVATAGFHGVRFLPLNSQQIKRCTKTRIDDLDEATTV